MALSPNKVLFDCEPQKAFWNCNGVVCRNIYELVSNIKALSKQDFRYHVNTDNTKNDFSKWIKDVLEDEELSKRLQKTYDKDRYVNIIERRIEELEK